MDLSSSTVLEMPISAATVKLERQISGLPASTWANMLISPGSRKDR